MCSEHLECPAKTLWFISLHVLLSQFHVAAGLKCFDPNILPVKAKNLDNLRNVSAPASKLSLTITIFSMVQAEKSILKI